MKRRVPLTVAVASLLALVACGSDDDSSSSETIAAATEGGSGLAGSLAGVCPETVVFQTDWYPESEHGQLYEMVGDGYTVDTGALRVAGPLVAGGVDTGVKIEVRAGGPAIGNQTVTSQLYADPSILLGYVSTDQAIQLSGEFPTKAVVAPFELDPQIIMWDPATYPDVKEIKDLKDTGTTVRYLEGEPFMEYLIASGQLDEDQTDGSYDGTPANFVAAGGKDAQQGFASAEPYFYENVLTEWGKPVAYQLIHDTGWARYTQSLAATPDNYAANTECFKKLVPIIQQAQVDYVNDQAETDTLILDLVSQYNSGWQYDEGQAKASVELQLSNRLVANGPDGALGSFDIERVTDFIATATPVFETAGATLKEDLTVDDLVTNEFIDPSIKL